jgi:hypothetical protein
MPKYTVRWVTYAEQQRESLPVDARRELNKLLDLLAERLGVPLVTCDAKLARSNGHHAKIELYPRG